MCSRLFDIGSDWNDVVSVVNICRWLFIVRNVSIVIVFRKWFIMGVVLFVCGLKKVVKLRFIDSLMKLLVVLMVVNMSCIVKFIVMLIRNCVMRI